MLRWLPLWLATGWLLVSAVVYLSLTPSPPELEIDHGDKLGHVAAYAVITFWFMQIYDRTPSRLRIALAFAVMGIVLEVVQGYGGHRTFDVQDMAANVAGVALGWLAGPPRTGNVFLRVEALVFS